MRRDRLGGNQDREGGNGSRGIFSIEKCQKGEMDM